MPPIGEIPYGDEYGREESVELGRSSRERAASSPGFDPFNAVVAHLCHFQAPKEVISGWAEA